MDKGQDRGSDTESGEDDEHVEDVAATQRDEGEERVGQEEAGAEKVPIVDDPESSEGKKAGGDEGGAKKEPTRKYGGAYCCVVNCHNSLYKENNELFGGTPRVPSP